MKSRHSVILFCVAVIILAALAIWLRRFAVTRPHSAEITTVPALSTNRSAAPSTTSPRFTVSSNSESAKALAEIETEYRQGHINKEQAEVAVLSNLNDIPIVFYGRLEDQFGNGVADATINFAVQVINGYEDTTMRGQIASDANGFFTISPGYKGQNLGLTPHKAGYVLAETNTLFWYSHLKTDPYVSDPSRPTVIRMWRLQGAEPLVGINKTFKLPYKGAPIYFDLVGENVVPVGGDLEVVVTRAPGVITQRKSDHGDWSIKLIPINGGIMETDYQAAQATFEAPTDGYQDSFFVQMNHDDPGWFDNVYKTFFMKSRNGQVYSKFSLGFMINDDPNGTMWFQFKGVANANGSRNWEATVPSQ